MRPNFVEVKEPIAESELILNDDGSVYHLKLKGDQIADNVILVGDPDRVEVIGEYLSDIENKSNNREFVSVTGKYNGQRITVLSSGIGTDNIDIVINELDAAVNFDFNTRMPKSEFRKLNLVRVGTSGALQPYLKVDSFLVSDYGMGLDGVMHFYDVDFEEDEEILNRQFKHHMRWNYNHASPYFVKGSANLKAKIGEGWNSGITATANGFYGPQGRSLRLKLQDPLFNSKMASFDYNGQKITNYEMETSALYSLAATLGHEAITVCAIIANRYNRTYSKDYKATVKSLIEQVLERLTS